MATILERIQEKYPGVTDDARNIAEAMAMVSGSGGRGAGAIADNIHLIVYVSRFPNGASGRPYATHGPAEYPIDLSEPSASANWEAPAGKVFAGWSQEASATEPIVGPFYSRTNTTLYAIWDDAE